MHRHRKGGGFLNPSVYSGDLRKLIGHVRAAVAEDVAALQSRGRSRDR
ncbi:hypothetical protein [Actinomadura macra]|nr:hypothetical protein [Actinomadura macra]